LELVLVTGVVWVEVWVGVEAMLKRLLLVVVAAEVALLARSRNVAAIGLC
jgi:hypothetical protein